jgi:hypothetical protein
MNAAWKTSGAVDLYIDAPPRGALRPDRRCDRQQQAQPGVLQLRMAPRRLARYCRLPLPGPQPQRPRHPAGPACARLQRPTGAGRSPFAPSLNAGTHPGRTPPPGPIHSCPTGRDHGDPLLRDYETSRRAVPPNLRLAVPPPQGHAPAHGPHPRGATRPIRASRWYAPPERRG